MKKYLPLLFVLLLGFIPLLDLFHPGLPITHDGQDHVARIANFYKNLEEGNVIPRWAANLNWGFGHPILMFLYPLPSYAASLFYFLGFSLVDSVKIVFGLAFVLSGVFMFLWLRNFLSELPAILGGLLYIFAPYRFVDLYVRGAVGEHVAFVFLPLVLYFLLKTTNDKNSAVFVIGGGLSLAGLLLSHNAISVMFIPLVLLYALYLLLNSKSKGYFLRLLTIIFLGFGLSSFFWIPAFFEGKYTLRDIVTMNEYKTRFVNFGDFFHSSWNYGGTEQFTKQLGIAQWLIVILSLPVSFSLFKSRKKLWILSLGSLIILLVTLFLMSSNSIFIWERLGILQKFQFPWRLLSIAVFISSVLGAIVLSQIKDYRKLLTVIFIILILFVNKDYWKAKDFLLKDEDFYTGIYNSTTDTGESSPIWSVRFMEKRSKTHLEVILGDAKISEVKRLSTYHEYKVKITTKTRFRENTLYFPGWEVYVDGKKTNIEFQDPSNRGLITFFAEPSDHSIIIKFKETKVRLFSNLVSLFSFVSAIFLLLFKRLRYNW